MALFFFSFFEGRFEQRAQGHHFSTNLGWGRASGKIFIVLSRFEGADIQDVCSHVRVSDSVIRHAENGSGSTVSHQ